MLKIPFLLSDYSFFKNKACSCFKSSIFSYSMKILITLKINFPLSIFFGFLFPFGLFQLSPSWRKLSSNFSEPCLILRAKLWNADQKAVGMNGPHQLVIRQPFCWEASKWQYQKILSGDSQFLLSSCFHSPYWGERSKRGKLVSVWGAVRRTGSWGPFSSVFTYITLLCSVLCRSQPSIVQCVLSPQPLCLRSPREENLWSVRGGRRRGVSYTLRVWEEPLGPVASDANF